MNWLRYLFVTICMLQIILIYPAVHADESDDDHNRVIPYALAISGGISLGAYEAGLNWTLVRYLKQEYLSRRQSDSSISYPELVAITGASAGSINGLITAINWCVEDARATTIPGYSDTVSDNLFRDIWINVGFDTLLPEEGYQDSDGILTRNAFAEQIRKIKHLMGQDIFRRENCDIPLGMMVTSQTSYEVNIAGLAVNNQRHLIPMVLKSNADGKAWFVTRPLAPGRPSFGNLIYLQSALSPDEDGDYAVDVMEVIDAALTSSAFPFAFGRKRLAVCRPESQARPGKVTASHTCPKGMVPEQDVFLDGGVFDNIPLGSAKMLAETGRQESGRRINYMYLDPGHRRADDRRKSGVGGVHGETPAEDSSQEKLTFDILSQGLFVSGLMATARDYELYKVLTSGDWDNTVFVYGGEVMDRIQENLAESTALGDGPGCEDTFTYPPSPEDEVNWFPWLRAAKRCLQIDVDRLEFAYQYQPASGKGLRELRSKAVRHIEWVDSILRGNLASNRGTRVLSDPLGDRRLLLSSRFYPITGQYLGHFGAFFDRPFRVFDYYAGVYDAITDIATYTCQFRNTQTEKSVCRVGEESRRLYLALGIDQDADARFVFSRLGKLEHAGNTGVGEEWDWLTTLDTTGAQPQMDALYVALFKEANPASEDGVLRADDFGEFIQALQEAGYPRDGSGEFYQYLVAPDKQWWELLALRVSKRLEVLEEDMERQTGKKSYFKQPFSLAHSGLNAWSQDKSIFAPKWSSSSVELGINVVHGGAPYLAWQPRFTVLDKEFLALRFALLKDNGDQPADDFLEVGGILNLSRANFQRYGLGFSAYRALEDNGEFNDAGVGMSVHYQIRNFRLTLGMRDFGSELLKNNTYANIGWVF